MSKVRFSAVVSSTVWLRPAVIAMGKPQALRRQRVCNLVVAVGLEPFPRSSNVNHRHPRLLGRLGCAAGGVVELLEPRGYLSGVAAASSAIDTRSISLPTESILASSLAAADENTTPPTATIDPTQPPGSNQSRMSDFFITYTDPVAVDAATLGNGNLVVTFPNGSQSEAATLVSTGLTDGPVVHAEYQITFAQDLTTANNGVYEVSLNAGSVKDTAGLAAAAGSIGTFTLTVTNPDVIAPTGMVDASQATPDVFSTTYDFTVTYADDVAVEPDTLGDSNLTVTYPDGTQHAATFVSQTNPSPTSIDATYQIAFPSDIGSADIGTYGVTIAADSVTDTSGNPVPAGNIGSFPISFGEVAPTGDFAVSAPTGTFAASVVSGSTQKGGATVVITYNGAATVTNAVVTTTLYTSATQIHDASAAQVGKAVTKRVGKLKPGTHWKIHFAPFAYPEAAGAEYLVSDVALNGVLDSYDGATPSPIDVQGPFVDADALAAVPSTATLVARKRASAVFTIENIGNIPIASRATVDVGVVPAGSPAGTAPTSIALAVPVTLHLNAGQTTKVRVSFTPTALPAAGSYDLAMQITAAGDTVTSNDTVFSTALITI